MFKVKNIVIGMNKGFSLLLLLLCDVITNYFTVKSDNNELLVILSQLKYSE